MTKPKILLVRANAVPPQDVVRTHMAVCPPLGLMYLAAYLRDKRPGAYDIEILDLGLERISPGDIGRAIAKHAPDIVGISALAPELDDCLATAREAREACPNARVVVGGPCTQTTPEKLAGDASVDCAVLGEGEETFLELVPKLLSGDPIEGVQGLYLKAPDGKVSFTGHRPGIADLDEMPFPAWDLIDLRRYSNEISMNGGLLAERPYAPVFTSRGCPWSCTYCHTIFGKKTQFRSPENVLQEMTMLVTRYGIREFHFYDDIFNLDGPRAGRIMDMIAERNWDVKLAFPNGLRGDILTPELVKKFRRAGTYLICFAIETVTPRLQKYIKKNVKLDKMATAIRAARDCGIIPLGFFMLGFPTETMEEIRDTVDWACKSDLLKAFFFTVVPYDNTEIADQVRDVTPEFHFDPMVSFHSPKGSYYCSVTGVDLARVQKNAYLRFYGNPRRLAQFFVRYPRKLDFFVNALYGLKLMFVRSSQYHHG